MTSYIGQVSYGKLIQVDRRTGIPTGVVKDNDPLDSDYIPPALDPLVCPSYKTEWVGDEDTAYCETETYYDNQVQSVTLPKTNCGPGYDGGEVTYTIPEGMFFASTQEEANTLAINYMNATKEEYMLTHGTCTPLYTTFKWIPDEDTAYCESTSTPITLTDSEEAYSGGSSVASIRIIDDTTSLIVLDTYNGVEEVHSFSIAEDGGSLTLEVNNIYGTDMYVAVDGLGYYLQLFIPNGTLGSFTSIPKTGTSFFITFSDMI